jgi:hypothetical protein
VSSNTALILSPSKDAPSLIPNHGSRSFDKLRMRSFEVKSCP